MPEAPRLISGRYRLDEHVGSAFDGALYHGVDVTLERPVTITLLEEPEDEAEARFRAELRCLAAVRHPALVEVFDAGEVDGVLFVVSARVDAQPLSERLGAGGLDVAATRRLAASLSQGLAAAHEVGVVHRGVSCETVRLDDGGRPRLTGFGLTGLAADSDAAPDDLFAAPEIRRRAQAGPAADVFGLGRVIQACLRSCRPDRDPELEELADAMTRVEPRERPRMTAVAEQLAGAAAATAPLARPGAAGEPTQQLSPSTPTTVGSRPSSAAPRPRAADRPRRQATLLAGIAGVALVALLGFAVADSGTAGGGDQPVGQTESLDAAITQLERVVQP